MSDPNRTPIPQPLQDWLAKANSRKRLVQNPGSKYTPTSAREALEVLTRTFVTQAPDIDFVCDDLVQGRGYPVPVRIYHPQPERQLPMAIFVHGGGHMAGSVSVYDPIARKFALASQRIVVSVDYRLAPEYPYPAGLQDVEAVIKGVYGLFNDLKLPYEQRLALIGDSGGGALCASIAHQQQFDPGMNIERQVLIYPSLDYTLSSPSVQEFAEGYLLELERINWMFDNYFQNRENRREVSPLYMPITEAYPPTFIITAEYCPLKDEGRAYAERLVESGIECEQLTASGMIHAFFNLEGLMPNSCRNLYARIGNFLINAQTSKK